MKKEPIRRNSNRQREKDSKQMEWAANKKNCVKY